MSRIVVLEESSMNCTVTGPALLFVLDVFTAETYPGPAQWRCPMPKSALLPCPANRRETLEAIAHALRGGALSDPFEDLAAWVAGVEVVESLERAGFTVVRTTAAAALDAAS